MHDKRHEEYKERTALNKKRARVEEAPVATNKRRRAQKKPAAKKKPAPTDDGAVEEAIDIARCSGRMRKRTSKLDL
tara:strand:- start:145 stop:372 length:228 start_codon:yes stop_codon:yes gene_type:complete